MPWIPIINIDLSRAPRKSRGFTIGVLRVPDMSLRPQEDVSRGEGRCTWFGTGGYVYSATGIRAS